jgi:hypothetical protein
MQQRTFQSAPQYVRVLGYFALVLAASLFLLYLSNVRAHFYYGAAYLSSLLYIAAYALFVGLGLLRLRKWAAIMLALSFCVTGMTLGALTIAKDHTLTTVTLAVFWAAVLCLPAVIVARSWHSLT